MLKYFTYLKVFLGHTTQLPKTYCACSQFPSSNKASCSEPAQVSLRLGILGQTPRP